MKDILKIAGAILLILIGIVGLILPIMPGWVFIIPGLVILAEYFPSVRRLLDWAKARLESVKTRTGGTPPAPVNAAAEFSATADRADPRTDPIRDR